MANWMEEQQKKSQGIDDILNIFNTPSTPAVKMTPLSNAAQEGQQFINRTIGNVNIPASTTQPPAPLPPVEEQKPTTPEKYIPGQQVINTQNPPTPSVTEKTTTVSTTGPATDYTETKKLLEKSIFANEEAISAEAAAEQAKLATLSSGQAEQQKLLDAQTKAENDRLENDRLVQARTTIEDASKTLESTNVSRKSFWDASSTGEKIGTAFNLLAALGYAFSRNPERAGQQVDKVLASNEAIVQRDIKDQERKRELFKETLMNRTNDYNRMVAWEQQQIALGAARTMRNLDFMAKKYDLLASNNAIPGQVRAKYAQESSKYLQQKADIAAKEAENIAKLKQEQVTREKVPTAPVNTEELRKTMTSMAELADKYTKPDTLVYNYNNAKDSETKIDNILNAPAGDPIRKAGAGAIAEAIAVGLKQASYGKDLAAEIQKLNLQGKIKELQKFVAGEAGEVPDEQLQSFKQLFRNVQQTIAAKPEFKQQYGIVQNANNSVSTILQQLGSSYSNQPGSLPTTPPSGNVKVRGNIGTK